MSSSSRTIDTDGRVRSFCSRQARNRSSRRIVRVEARVANAVEERAHEIVPGVADNVQLPIKRGKALVVDREVVRARGRRVAGIRVPISTLATTHCGCGPVEGAEYASGSKRHHASGATEALIRKYRAVVPLLGCPATTILNLQCSCDWIDGAASRADTRPIRVAGNRLARSGPSEPH